MAKSLFRCFYRTSSLLKPSPPNPFLFRSVFPTQESIFYTAKQLVLPGPQNPSWVFRNLSHGSVNLVISEGKPKFEMHEVDPPKKEKWKTKKKLKLQRKREKQQRKAANKKDPRRLGIKGKKKKFANAEERIKYKLEKAKIKEAMLIERLKRYEIPKVQGPVVEPVQLTGEERFYIKKMAQKKSNYVPVGRRGIFGGLILNMHMHWKKHETVKVICNSSKPGQLHEYAQEIARLSGGIPIHVIGDDTIIFYRGKNYVQPEIMSPIDTLSKKKALEKSKYEQSLESVQRFIAIAEKELELYHRHVALYGDPNDRNPLSILDSPGKDTMESNEPKILGKEKVDFTYFSTSLSEKEADSVDLELCEIDDNSEDESLSTSESDSGGNILVDSDDEVNSSEMRPSIKMLGSSKQL
ncbi:CRM-domain containing factor CFM9, mitochondrial [Ziziphus jujuba]|uniref:CRM-domain containing factor CFM9, mitochondrial n=1 Tax=Ziziphus jujuba TaxID=326968 RepID=A0ABM3IQB8_ZIZJJ|nr:CRM-domain containing factor CFM9, mitochondrial [Ziziphus jujuba]